MEKLPEENELTSGQDLSSADLLSQAERRQLLALGNKLLKLESERDGLLIKARSIIGFEVAECERAFSEELAEALDTAWGECAEETVFVVYATSTRKRWELESALEKIKGLMKSLGLKPEDLDWDNT
jgi:hypothetical protein